MTNVLYLKTVLRMRKRMNGLKLFHEGLKNAFKNSPTMKKFQFFVAIHLVACNCKENLQEILSVVNVKLKKNFKKWYQSNASRYVHMLWVQIYKYWMRFFSFERQNGHLYVWYYLHFVQRKNALQRYAFLKIVISLELNISKDCFLNGPTTKVLSIWCPTGYLPF